MGRTSRFVSKIVGEISRFRESTLSAGSSIPYTLSSQRVDYELAKSLYRNTADSYKLGGAFAKTIIDTIGGFIGAPQFQTEDETGQILLDELTKDWRSKIIHTHEQILVQGDFYWLFSSEVNSENELYLDKEARINVSLLPPSMVDSIQFDPVTKEAVAYVLKGTIDYIDIEGNKKNYKYKRIYTAEEIITEAEGDIPQMLELGTIANPWGFIPIIHFRNEPDEESIYGFSELEPLEPFIKAYHDVFMHAMQGSKLHSTPKIKMQVKNVEVFLKNNFPEAYEIAKKGGSPKITLDNKDIILLTQDETADFLECSSVTGGAETLLKFIFYCIVDLSGVPELIFGVHLSSSHASAKEQMPVLVRRVTRKRDQLDESWKTAVRMALVMQSKNSGRKLKTYDVNLKWDVVVEKDEQEWAETIKCVVEALVPAVQNALISVEAAVSFLGKYIDTISDYAEDDQGECIGEKRKIVEGLTLIAAAAEPTLLAALQQKEIEANE